jgi:hypothetical protein
MTGQNHADGRAPDSRDVTFALLATRLSELSEQVGGLIARVTAVEEASGDQARVLAQTADLAREVSRLSVALTTQDSGPERSGLAHPRQPAWTAMNRAEYVSALRDLAGWVTGILFPRYPATAAVLPPCWPAHPAVVEELDWLYWDWTAWATDSDARSRDAADWHDRWLPGVLARIRPQLAACGQQGRHENLTTRRPIPADLRVAGQSPEAAFIEQMAGTTRRDRHYAAKQVRRPAGPRDADRRAGPWT